MSEQRKYREYRSWRAKQKLEIVLAGLKGDRGLGRARRRGLLPRNGGHGAAVPPAVRAVPHSSQNLRPGAFAARQL